VKRWTYW